MKSLLLVLALCAGCALSDEDQQDEPAELQVDSADDVTEQPPDEVGDLQPNQAACITWAQLLEALRSATLSGGGFTSSGTGTLTLCP